MTPSKRINNFDMTRGQYRRLYAGFVTGRRINSVSVDAEALFVRLVVKADDYGALVADPVLLKAEVAPLRAWTHDRIGELLAELAGTDPPLIVFYEVGRERYLHVAGHLERQNAGPNGRRVARVQTPPAEVLGVPGESGGIPGNPAGPVHYNNHNHHHKEEPPPPPEQRPGADAPEPGGGGGAAGAGPGGSIGAMLTRAGVAPAEAASIAATPGMTAALVVAHWADVAGDESVRNAGAVLARRLRQGQTPPKPTPKSLVLAIKAGIVEAVDGRRVDPKARLTQNAGGVFIDGEALVSADALPRARLA